MNAPWWRLNINRESKDVSQSAIRETDDDLLPPFVD